MTYASNLALDARTPQTIVELHMSRCENHYTVNSKPNQLLRSEEFDNASWTKTNLTVTANAATDPLGGSTADKLEDSSGATIGLCFQTSALAAASKTGTWSVWLKADAPRTITLSLNDALDSEGTTVAIKIGTTWERYSVTRTFTGAATGNMRVYVRPTDLVAAETGYCYAWGAQLTETAFPLTYTKTTTATAQTSACTATDQGDGARCGYAFYAACQDQANFKSTSDGPNPGIRVYKFCYKDLPLAVSGIGLLPYLIDYSQAEQKIDPAKALTYRERASLTFTDEPMSGVFDVDKLPGLINTSTAGTFWRRWREEHRNYTERRVVIREGFVGDPESEYTVAFDGLMSDFRLNDDGTCTIEAVNKLKRTERKIPRKISDTNVLTDFYAFGPTLSVSDATEFTDPARLSASAEVIVEVGYNTTRQLSGVVIFTNGSNVVTGSGTKFLSESVFAGAITTHFLWADSDDEVHAQVVEAVASDTALTLARPYTGRGGQARASVKKSTFFKVTSVDIVNNQLAVTHSVWGTPDLFSNTFAPGASIREVVWLGTDTGNSIEPVDVLDAFIQLLRRGAVPEADIDVTGIQAQRDAYHSGTSFVPVLELIPDETPIEEKIQALTEIGGFDIVVSPAGQIGVKVYAPPGPADVLPTLDDAASFIAGTLSAADDDEDNRLTAVTVAWDRNGLKDGDKADHYQRRVTRINAAAESTLGFGDQKEYTILSRSLFGSGAFSAAIAAAGRKLARHVDGAKTVPFSLELKDATIKIGDFVTVSTARIQSLIGATAPGLYQIMSKRRSGQNRYSYKALQAFKKRIAIIGQNSMASDYDSATATDLLYGYIGDANNKVGNAKADGYYIF